LFKISSIFFIQKNEIDPILDTETIVNIVIWWGQLNTVHVHSDWNDFTFVRASIHDFILYQSVGLCGSLNACSKSFLSDETDLHTFYFYFNEMETDFTNNDVFQMIKLLVPFEFNMKTIFNTDLHLHWGDLCLLDFIVRDKDCEVKLFGQCSFHISCQSASNKISDSSSNTIECFILLLEVGELEFDCFAISQYSCGF
jgi:hypothetical protein